MLLSSRHLDIGAPDIMCVSCWQAAAAAMLFWELYHSSMPEARLALTLHNMDSQGECSQEEFQFTGAEPGVPRANLNNGSKEMPAIPCTPEGNAAKPISTSGEQKPEVQW